MKEPYGYYTGYGYRGYVERLGRMIEFATREEYYEFIKEDAQCI